MSKQRTASPQQVSGDQKTRLILRKEAGATAHSQRKSPAKMSNQWGCPAAMQGRDYLCEAAVPRNEAGWFCVCGPTRMCPQRGSMEHDTGVTLGEETRGSKGRDRAETSLVGGMAALGNCMSREG